MRKLLQLTGTVFALAASAAFAHSESPTAGAQLAAATSIPQPAVTTGTRDPRVYFTDAELVTQDGRKVRFYSDMLSGKVAVVNVMYTSCTDACPLITKQLTQVRDDLGTQFGKKVFFVSISSDPERDTPQALKKFAQKQNADVAGWTFLTGNKKDVTTILKRLGNLSENVEEHTPVLMILDVDRKLMRKMMPNLPPKAIAEAARQIAATGKNTVASTLPHAN